MENIEREREKISPLDFVKEQISLAIGKVWLYSKRLMGIEEDIVEESSPIYMYRVRSVDDAMVIGNLVAHGYLVLASYKNLTEEERTMFTTNLSKQLLPQGTHFDRVTDGVLICGKVGAIEPLNKKNNNFKLIDFASSQEVVEEPEEIFVPPLENKETPTFYSVYVQHPQEAYRISRLVEEGYIVLAYYGKLDDMERIAFMGQLNNELEEQNGKHLKITKGVMMCAQAGLISRISPESEKAKVYNIADYRKKIGD